MSLARATQVKTSSDFLYGLSGQLWPVHLKPQPYELLSSWLTRLAHGHGLKLQTFCAIVFGNEKNIWNRDLDKFAPDWLIEKIAVATGTSIKSVINTTLKSYEGVLYETHQPNGNTRWVNPLGIYHRKHQHYGLQFCPICLAQDRKPYFRKYWRLAFYTECEKHHILLHDRCPDCGYAINFHRAEMGIRTLIKPKSIVHCYKCGFDLRQATNNFINCENWETTVQFRTLLEFHELGWLFTNKCTFNYSHQLFDVLRHLCVLISSNHRAKCLLPFIAEKLKINASMIARFRTTSFEKCGVHDRHVLFHCALWLIADWPERFIWVSNSHNLTKAYLLHDFADPPFWFLSVINRELNHTQYSPAKEEINSAKNYLINKDEKAGITRVSHLMGYTTLKRPQ